MKDTHTVIIRLQGRNLAFRARISDLAAAKVIGLLSLHPDTVNLKPPKFTAPTPSKITEKPE